MTRSRLSAAGLLLAVFALGALAGHFGPPAMEHHGAGASRLTRGREGILTRLNSELQLSTTQQDSIRAILQRHEPAMDSMWREVRPRFDSLRDVVRAEIRVQLTPDQQRKYTEMNERRDREYRQRGTDARD
jgi:hypothetical protein